MSEIINQLIQFGDVEVIKNDYAFTLLMTKDKINLSSQGIPIKVLGIVKSYLGNDKPNIEVMKNEENYLLLVLKP